MMDRIKDTFRKLRKKGEKALMPFVVIGDPDYKTSLQIVKRLSKYADMLELGIPFSDPIADGPTIQSADVRALKKGINTDIAFRFIKDIRKFTQMPIGLLVYYNLIYQRGIARFYRECKSTGVDSVLAADVPIEEAGEIIREARKNKVSSVFIVSPLTEKERLKKIVKNTRGFVYIVSRLGVTGARKELQRSTLELIMRVRSHTKLPLCVGFGISKPEHVRAICKAGADCAIIGSAIVKIIEKNLKNKKLMLKRIEEYTKKLKEATRTK